MKRVLLVCKSKVMENLGVMYLSAVVKQAGGACKIVDIEHAEEIALKWKPDIIGYSIMTGDQGKFEALNARIRRRVICQSIVGGPHPTFFKSDCDWANVVIQGEAEQVIADLMQTGLKFPDINAYPYPDRVDFPGMKIRDFITTRGCPYNCSYCYNQKWAELFPGTPRVQTRKVDNVIREINEVDPEFVYFQDSCFGLSMKWLREFSVQYRKDINVPYHCHLRPTQVDEERVELLAESGCMSVRIALESASERLRHMMNRKNVRHEDVLRAVRLLKGWGIKLMVQNIIGMPTATIEEDLETLEFNIRCKPAYSWVSIFMPYPGTVLGDMCKKKGWYPGDYSDLADNFFDTSYLDITWQYREQLECLQKVFALCVENQYLPSVKELTHKNLPKLVHKVMRKQGDCRLYGNIL
jgi:radical SAM superfamily enzyme YgiQ (UPF0313 family)